MLGGQSKLETDCWYTKDSLLVLATLFDDTCFRENNHALTYLWTLPFTYFRSYPGGRSTVTLIEREPVRDLGRMSKVPDLGGIVWSVSHRWLVLDDGCKTSTSVPLSYSKVLGRFQCFGGFTTSSGTETQGPNYEKRWSPINGWVSDKTEFS